MCCKMRFFKHLFIIIIIIIIIILQLNINSSVPFGQLRIVKRFKNRPSLPRYTATWDLSSVLNYFRKGASVSALSLKDLTLKLTFFVNPVEWTKVSNSQILSNQ